MTEVEKPHWIQGNAAKIVTFAIAIIGCLIGIYKLIIEPTAEIAANYSVSTFELPDYLKHATKSDTIAAGQAAFIRRLDRAYLDQLSFKERLFVSDSLNPFKDKYVYSSDSYPQLQRFALGHSGFAALSVKNEGKKLVKQLQILHESPVYYEFKDSGGHLQAGRSETKFSIGELSPTEKREVSLWFTSRLSLGKQGIVVTYDDGRVIAEQPSEVTGTIAWLIDHWFTVSYTLLLFISIVAPFLITRASYKRNLAIKAAREEGRLDAEKTLQVAQTQAAEFSQQFNKMLGINQPPPAP